MKDDGPGGRDRCHCGTRSLQGVHGDIIGRLGIDKDKVYKTGRAVCGGTKNEEDIHSGGLV